MNSKVKKSISLTLATIVLFSTVFAILNPLAFGAQQLVITVQTEKPWYLPGERVQIFGTVTNTTNYPMRSTTVAIEVKDPRGNTIFLDIVYSGADGNYRDSFRLSSNARIGQYTIYVTASKTGYLSAASQCNFNVTTEQLGETTISIAGHSISFQADNQVKAQLNITLFSQSLTWIATSNRLVVTNPKGTKVYDNFFGLGGSLDYKLATVYNSSFTTINFQFTLTESVAGHYIAMFGVYDVARTTSYATTSWMPVFLSTPPPIYTQDLGTLGPELTKQVSLSLSMKRFELAMFRVTLPQPTKTLSMSMGTHAPDKLLVTINQSDNFIQQELFMNYSLSIFNLPTGTYDIKITALSNVASLSSLFLQSGSIITTPSVSITKVEATSKSATPGGTINYHVYLEWTITATDILNVSAYVAGSQTDVEEIDVIPLNYNQRDVYLTVNAPDTSGIYDVNIVATLKQAGTMTQSSTTLNVQTFDYNITVVNFITYYKEPSAWQWIRGTRSRKYFDDSSQLQALSITEIRVINVGLDESNKPVNATIEFLAKNKAGTWLKFGEGPHYNIWIEDMTGQDFLVAVILAGDQKTVSATLPLDSVRRLIFTIKFKISLEAEFMLLAAGAFEIVVTVWTSGLSSVLLKYAGDIVKLTALYTYEIWVERDRGFMALRDIAAFTIELHVKGGDALIESAEEIFKKNGFNPAYAILSALWDFFTDGKIDAWKMATALIKLFLWIINRAKPSIAKTVIDAFNKACSRYFIEIPAKSLEAVDKFVQNLQSFFAVFRSLKVLYDLGTKQPEEGKIVGSTVGTDSAVKPFDPVVSISYSGPTLNTTIDYFGDVYSLTANITQIDSTNATGKINYIVDPNMTSIYLSIISLSTFQRDLFKSFGQNATSTNLMWQEGSNVFQLEGNGTMYSGLHKTSISLNNTWIQGQSEMSGDAIQVGDTAWFNSSLIYPFGKNLTYSISVTFPAEFTILQILSNGSYTRQDNTITWSTPIDWIAVEFISPHDIAITDITTSKTVIAQNETLNIDVTVINQGNLTESFNVTAYANTTIIQTQQVTLAKGNSATITFMWNTTGFAKGNYTISAYAIPIANEVDTSDNTLVAGIIVLTILGDINGDRAVNALDLSVLNEAYGSTPPSTNWNANADLNNDQIVSVFDLWIFSKNYGKTV